MPTRQEQRAAPPLTDLGFAPLEAAIYTHLLRHGPGTGYRIAQLLGKPVANTYNAIESLQSKGAVVSVEEGDTRIVRAIEPAELFAAMRKGFARQCQAAEKALTRLSRPTNDHHVYALRSREQVLERARAMLADCAATAVMDIFPGLAAELEPDLRSAAARGVAVGALVYEPTTIPGAHIVEHARPALVRDTWPGESVVLITDAQEHLTAMITPAGEVDQGLWTRSLFLSVIHHDGIVCQLLTQLLDHALAGHMTFEQLRGARERFRAVSILKTPGYAQFTHRAAKPAHTPEPQAAGESHP